MMDPKTILGELERLAEQVGIKVRYERISDEEIEIRSGRCRLKGSELVIIDRRLGTLERIEILRQELTGRNWDGVFLKPYFRELLESKD